LGGLNWEWFYNFINRKHQPLYGIVDEYAVMDDSNQPQQVFNPQSPKSYEKKSIFLIGNVKSAVFLCGLYLGSYRGISPPQTENGDL